MTKPTNAASTQNQLFAASIRSVLPRFAFVALAILAIAAVAGTTANAAYLNADGNFNAQSNGVAIGSPWGPVSGGGNAGSPAAQSPFTNAFANNNIGASVPATSGNPYFVGEFAGVNSGAGASGNLYFNVDFENLSSNLGNGGAYSLLVTNSADGSQRQATLYVSGTNLYADGSTGLVNVMSLQPNTWYNAQLTLDLATRTFSGEVTPFGGSSTAIAPLGFTTGSTTISGIYSDGGTAGGFHSQFIGTAPDHNIDNFVLSNQAIAAVPEPSTVMLLAVGMVSLSFYGRRVKRARA